KPTALTATPTTLCYGASTTGLNFSVTGNTGLTTAIRWYAADPRTGGTFITNPNGTNSVNFPMSSYTAANGAIGAPINTSRAAGAGGVYSVWATQIQGATNACESDPVEVVLTVRPQLTAPPQPGGSSSVCNGSTGIAYTQASATTNQT